MKPQAGKPWSPEEVELTVDSYMCMLRQDLQGETYSKSAHRRELRQQLPERTDRAIEYKHRNISAVLEEMGLPYVSGYKPKAHLQNALRAQVESSLNNNVDLFHLLEQRAGDSETRPR